MGARHSNSHPASTPSGEGHSYETPEQRRARGRALRDTVPRADHGIRCSCRPLPLARVRSFPDAVGEFAVAYADQNLRDCRAFMEHVRSGRIQAILDT